MDAAARSAACDQHYMSGKLNRRNVRQFRALHYVSAIWALSFRGAQSPNPEWRFDPHGIS